MIARINSSLARKRTELEENQKGFTLVELLVVVLIIGILAAIAIPFFLNQRESAWVGQVESDIKNAVTAAETYGSANNGDFSGLTGSGVAADGTFDAEDENTLSGNGFRPTEDVTIDIDGTAGTTYTITGSHANLEDGAREWVYDSATGLTTEPEED